MARLVLVPGFLGLVLLLFWLWALFDVALTDSARMRSGRKRTWILLVVLLASLGGAAWLLFGRPAEGSLWPGGGAGADDGDAGRAGRVGGDGEPGGSGEGRRRPSGGTRGAPRRSLGPEDSPGWSAGSTPSRPDTSKQSPEGPDATPDDD